VTNYAFYRQTDTDRQTSRQTEFSSLDRVCIPCSAVKTTKCFQNFCKTFFKIYTVRLCGWTSPIGASVARESTVDGDGSTQRSRSEELDGNRERLSGQPHPPGLPCHYQQRFRRQQRREWRTSVELRRRTSLLGHRHYNYRLLTTLLSTTSYHRFRSKIPLRLIESICSACRAHWLDFDFLFWLIEVVFLKGTMLSVSDKYKHDSVNEAPKKLANQWNHIF